MQLVLFLGVFEEVDQIIFLVDKNGNIGSVLCLVERVVEEVYRYGFYYVYVMLYWQYVFLQIVFGNCV